MFAREKKLDCDSRSRSRRPKNKARQQGKNKARQPAKFMPDQNDAARFIAQQQQVIQQQQKHIEAQNKEIEELRTQLATHEGVAEASVGPRDSVPSMLATLLDEVMENRRSIEDVLAANQRSAQRAMRL